MTIRERIDQLRSEFAYLSTARDRAGTLAFKDAVGKLLDEIEAKAGGDDDPLWGVLATVSIALLDAEQNPAGSLHDLARAAATLPAPNPAPERTKPVLEPPSKPQDAPREMAATIPTYLTTKELQGRLKLSRMTLYRMRAAGLPFVRVGKEVRYDPEAVLRWIDQQGGNAFDGE